MRFKIKDSNIELMPGNPHFLILAKIEYFSLAKTRGREFWVLHCRECPHIVTEKKLKCYHKGDCPKNKTYIEEFVKVNIDWKNDTYASLMALTDEDELFEDLHNFIETNKLIDVKKIADYLIDQGRGKLLGINL